MRQSAQIIVILLAFAGCKPSMFSEKKTGNKARSGVVGPPAPSGADGAGAGTGAGVSKVATVAGKLPPRPKDLPLYLFTLDEAKAIKTLVEPYRKPDFDESDATYSSDHELFRKFAESYLNSLFKLPALQPGRTVTVQITDQEFVNAFADGFQRVVINAGTLKAVDSKALLAILCHELAHSTQNHSVKRHDFEEADATRAKLQAFYDAGDEFLSKTFDEDKSTYKHDSAAYQKILPLWEKAKPVLGSFQKRKEGEADIVGGMICGQIGMKLDEFKAGQANFFAIGDRIDAELQTAGTVEPKDLTDGETFDIELEDLIPFLFPRDSHPTNTERDQQLARTAEAITAHYDPTQRFVMDFASQYDAARGFGLAGFQALSIQELIVRQIKSVKTSKGRTVRLHRGTSCSNDAPMLLKKKKKKAAKPAVKGGKSP